MDQGFLAQATQNTIDLATKHADVFVPTALKIMAYVTGPYVLMHQFYQVAYGREDPSSLWRPVLTVFFLMTMLTHYSTPIPGIGKGFHKTITDMSADLAGMLDDSTAQDVGAAAADAMNSIFSSLWAFIRDPGILIRLMLVLCALSLIQVVLLVVSSFGIVVLGCLVLVGPLMLSILPLPRIGERFGWGWLYCFIQYSLYPVVANAFMYVYGQIMLHYFEQFHGKFNVQVLAGSVVELIGLALGAVFGIVLVPMIVSQMCSGGSGLSAVSSLGLFRK